MAKLERIQSLTMSKFLNLLKGYPENAAVEIYTGWECSAVELNNNIEIEYDELRNVVHIDVSVK